MLRCVRGGAWKGGVCWGKSVSPSIHLYADLRRSFFKIAHIHHAPDSPPPAGGVAGAWQHLVPPFAQCGLHANGQVKCALPACCASSWLHKSSKSARGSVWHSAASAHAPHTSSPTQSGSAVQSTPKGSVFGAAQHLAPAGEHDALHRWVISGPCCASVHPAPAANSAQVSDTFPLPTKPLLTASTHALHT